MSIYPVYLCSWYGKKPKLKGDEPSWYLESIKSNHEIAKIVVQHSKCVRCNRKCTWKKAWGHHSLPFGNGDVWCSLKCLRR